MPATVPATPILSVLPDCCNIGVILRTLLAVNGAVMVAILAQAPTLGSAILSFIEASMLVELACLASLLLLCASRKLLSGFPAWVQRLACTLVPAAVTALIIRLLATLMERPGRVWSREQLLDRVWGRDIYVDTRTVDVHVGRLRKALMAEGGDDPLRTVRGAGYALG